MHFYLVKVVYKHLVKVVYKHLAKFVYKHLHTLMDLVSVRKTTTSHKIQMLVMTVTAT